MLRFIALGVMAFLVILVAQFPARWSRWALPAGVECQQLDGSVWSGRCDGLRVQHRVLGDATWRLHPLGLLRARLDADVELFDGPAALRGRLAAGPGGRIDARDLTVQNLRLERLPSSQLAGLRGVLQAQVPVLRWSGKRIEALAGTFTVQGMFAQGTPLGNYQLEFPRGAPTALIGTLRDTGAGPLRVDGSLRLLPAPGFELNARVAARTSAAPALADQIRYLGSPDADGMRPFSFAETF